MKQVVNWNGFFEGAKSKTYNNKTSCQMPTKHGLGYRRLINMQNGAALFGAWCSLVQLLSRHPKPRNGYISNDGTSGGDPLTPKDLQMLTDIKYEIYEAMINACESKEIGWIRTCKDTIGNHKDTIGNQQDTIIPLNSDLDLDSDLDSKEEENASPSHSSVAIKELNEWFKEMGAPLTINQIKKWQDAIGRVAAETDFTVEMQAAAFKWARDKGLKLPKANFWREDIVDWAATRKSESTKRASEQNLYEAH